MPLNSSEVQDSLSVVNKDVKTLLPKILHLNLQYETTEKMIINSLNRNLSLSKSRGEGLETLNLIIHSCSPDAISENALTWINRCLIQYPGDNLKEVKLITIGKKKNSRECVQTSGIYKKFISDYIAKILDICISIHINPHETEAALKTLTICMRRYASWFTVHKSKIEIFLLRFLDNSSNTLVRYAAEAFLYLQQVGGAGIDGIKHKQNFSTTLHKLCITAHTLFDILFENEIEIERYEFSSEDGITFSDSCDSQRTIQLIVRRLINCLKFIEIMILKGFPVVKEIKPVEILNIVSRGTALHLCLTSETERQFQEFEFSLLLNKIQIVLLQLLRVFIAWFQTNSLPFAYCISKILVDCLIRSQNCECFESNSEFRETVYKVLSDWMKISRCSLHVHFQSQLISCILKDITSIKTQITLTVKDDIKNKSDKFKRKALHERIIASGQADNVRALSATEKRNQIKNCHSALNTLKELLINSYVKVNVNKLQELHSSVLGTLIEINKSKFSHPYTNSYCQMKLYETLLAFYEQDTLPILPPLQLSLDILNKGVSSYNTSIVSVCINGINNLEKLCQPLCPPLYVPEPFLSKQTNNEVNLFNDNITNQFEGERYVVDDKGKETEEVPDNIVVELEANRTKSPTANDESTDVENDESTKDIENENNYDIGKNDNTIVQTLVNTLDIEIVNCPTTKEQCINQENDHCVSETDTILLENLVEGQDENAFAPKDDIDVEINIFKQEVLSNLEVSSLESKIESEELIEVVDHLDLKLINNKADRDEDEPPCKIPRVELEEVKSSENDNRPEDDDDDDEFVDEVKKY